MNERYEAALKYLQLGWSVIPMNAQSKRPYVKWKEFQSRLATLAELENWWRKWPEANVGVITGALSNLCVLDQDEDSGAQEIEARGGLPETLTNQTRSGFHYLFEYPDFEVRNWVKELPGLDFRGEGGYFVAPPSVHASGHFYDWCNETPIAQLPEWLRDFLYQHEQAKHAPKERPELPPLQREHLNGHAHDPDQTRRFIEGCFRSELAKIHSAPDGEKHKQLLKSSTYLSGYINTGATSADEIESILYEAIAPRADDPKNALETIHDGIKYGREKPLQVPEPKKLRALRGREARQFISKEKGTPKKPTDDDGESEAENASQSADADERAVENGLYAIQNGRTVLSVEKEKSDEKGSSGSSQKSFIWDGAACIVGEISDEDGTTVYEVVGRTIRNRTFHFEIDAAKLGDPRAVSAVFNNYCGATSVIYAGMEKHLAPSLRSFTDEHDLRHGRRFKRVGWTQDGKEFIIPGIEPDDVVMALSRDLAYRVEAPELSDSGTLTPEVQTALETLLAAHKTSLTTVALAHSLLAPLANICGWRDDKFALFIAGRTGSFKTSWASMLMCLFGDFSNEDKLLKFGMGGTNNALMAYTASACDVPLLIDNFKPGTGNGQKDAQSLIHGVIEGGEKKRLNRDGTMRDGKEIHCWPLLTGEDVLDDAAAIARMIIVAARWDGGDNPNLTAVQGMAHLLPQVGGAWLQWLMSDEARAIAREIKPRFYPRRSQWNATLQAAHPDMVNISRVASSLALLECTWDIALRCPALRATLQRHEKDFASALNEAAMGMGNYAAQTHEANRYMSAVSAMVLSGRGYLAEKNQDADKEDRRAFLGWQDNEFVYLQPDNAYREVLEFLRHSGGLNGLGMNTIHRQLEQLGHIAKRDGKNITARKRLGARGEMQRVLWLQRNKLFESEHGDEDE